MGEGTERNTPDNLFSRLVQACPDYIPLESLVHHTGMIPAEIEYRDLESFKKSGTVGPE